METNLEIYTVPGERVVHKTQVDFVDRIVVKPLFLVQYDKELPIIEVELLKEGKPYSVPENAKVRVRFGKRDHTYVWKPVLGSNAERNIVYFDFDDQMSILYGPVNPIIEVVVPDNQNGTYHRAGSSAIPINIERDPIQNTDIKSDIRNDTIDQAVADAEKARDEAREAAAEIYEHSTENVFGNNFAIPNLTLNTVAQFNEWHSIPHFNGTGTIKYQPSTGIFEIDGEINSGNVIIGIYYQHDGTDLTGRANYISGTNTTNVSIIIGSPYIEKNYLYANTDFKNGTAKTTKTAVQENNTIRLYFWGGTFDKYRFRYKLEYGSVATPYSIPIIPITNRKIIVGQSSTASSVHNKVVVTSYNVFQNYEHGQEFLIRFMNPIETTSITINIDNKGLKTLFTINTSGSLVPQTLATLQGKNNPLLHIRYMTYDNQNMGVNGYFMLLGVMYNSLDAGIITSGTFNLARIPDIPTSKITGRLPLTQIEPLRLVGTIANRIILVRTNIDITDGSSVKRVIFELGGMGYESVGIFGKIYTYWYDTNTFLVTRGYYYDNSVPLKATIFRENNKLVLALEGFTNYQTLTVDVNWGHTPVASVTKPSVVEIVRVASLPSGIDKNTNVTLNRIVDSVDLDKKVDKTTNIASKSTDLSTIQTSGFYFLANYPFNITTTTDQIVDVGYSQMIVSRGGDTITQIISHYANQRFFQRSGNQSTLPNQKWTEMANYASINDLESRKLDKQTVVTSRGQVYTKNADGSQGMRVIAEDVISNSVPYRDGNGNINTALTPTEITHATSKQYVDTELTGTVNNVLYEPSTHIMTFKRKNAADITVDLLIPVLLKTITTPTSGTATIMDSIPENLMNKLLLIEVSNGDDIVFSSFTLFMSSGYRTVTLSNMTILFDQISVNSCDLIFNGQWNTATRMTRLYRLN